MRWSIYSIALASAFTLTPVAGGFAPACSQDFSITNPEEPANAGRRDLLRQLQNWWNVHAYYPRHASNNDEGGNVKLHLAILPDGRIWGVNAVDSSGSNSIDAAAAAAFTGGFVRPFPEGSPEADLDISVHYVLAHRHNEPMSTNYTPIVSKSAFTITNDPVKSPILTTMLQRTCTGKVVKEGIRNHPEYGGNYWAQAIFFRKPDNTPWVKFYEGGYPILSPVTEIGKTVQWTGRQEHLRGGLFSYTQYTVWPDGDNNLSGSLQLIFSNEAQSSQPLNRGGTVDFVCATETVPAITWSALSVTPGERPPGDPP